MRGASRIRVTHFFSPLFSLAWGRAESSAALIKGGERRLAEYLHIKNAAPRNKKTFFDALCVCMCVCVWVSGFLIEILMIKPARRNIWSVIYIKMRAER